MLAWPAQRRGRGRMRRVTWSSSCSRNVHDRNVLVRRARLGSSHPPLITWQLAAASPDELFEHPAGSAPSCSIRAGRRMWIQQLA
jgi:hypothetical protein